MSSETLPYKRIFLFFFILYCFFSPASPHSQSLSSGTFSSRPATFPVLLPFAVSPQAKPVLLVLQLLLRLTRSRDSHLSCCWNAPSLRPAFRNAQESSAKSTRRGKLLMPFGNLIIWAGSDRLPGKEFPGTSSQGEERENISLTYIDGFLTCHGPCPSPVIRLKAEALLPVTEAHPV